MKAREPIQVCEDHLPLDTVVVMTNTKNCPFCRLARLERVLEELVAVARDYIPSEVRRVEGRLDDGKKDVSS